MFRNINLESIRVEGLMEGSIKPFCSSTDWNNFGQNYGLLIQAINSKGREVCGDILVKSLRKQRNDSSQHSPYFEEIRFSSGAMIHDSVGPASTFKQLAQFLGVQSTRFDYEPTGEQVIIYTAPNEVEDYNQARFALDLAPRFKSFKSNFIPAENLFTSILDNKEFLFTITKSDSDLYIHDRNFHWLGDFLLCDEIMNEFVNLIKHYRARSALNPLMARFECANQHIRPDFIAPQVLNDKQVHDDYRSLMHFKSFIANSLETLPTYLANYILPQYQERDIMQSIASFERDSPIPLLQDQHQLRLAQITYAKNINERVQEILLTSK